MSVLSIDTEKYSQLFDIANVCEGVINCSKFGSCIHFANQFVVSVSEYDRDLLSLIRIIEGYVRARIGEDYSDHPHTYILLNNGKIIDPTFKQFSEHDRRSYLIEGKIAESYTGEEYLKLALQDDDYSKERWKFIT